MNQISTFKCVYLAINLAKISSSLSSGSKNFVFEQRRFWQDSAIEKVGICANTHIRSFPACLDLNTFCLSFRVILAWESKF